MSDSPRRKNTQTDAQEHGQQSQKAASTLHLVNTAIGFVSRLLYYNGPVQRGNRTVSPQHFSFVLTVANGEFSSSGQLCFGAVIDKATYDVGAGHVLPRCEFRGGGSDQSSLTINHV